MGFGGWDGVRRSYAACQVSLMGGIVMFKRAMAIAAISLGIVAAASVPAFADPPGPGDKQCVPGQQGNPHPAYKAGACK